MIPKIKSFVYRMIRNGSNLLFESICRLRIRNRNFTILCSNCIGGIIYNRLGMQFLSPTINLFIRQYDFIKFIGNPQFYLSQELMFIETEYPFPVGLLGDIRIHFNHSDNEADALLDWERRKKRINWDNLYIIMYDRDGLTREQIYSLSHIRCKQLIVLSERNVYPELDYVYHIKRSGINRNNDQVFLDDDFFGLRTFEKQWDFVKWLNRR